MFYRLLLTIKKHPKMKHYFETKINGKSVTVGGDYTPATSVDEVPPSISIFEVSEVIYNHVDVFDILDIDTIYWLQEEGRETF